MSTLPRTATARPTRSPILREAQFEDFPQIATMADATGFTLPRSFEEWKHLWANNPAYLKAGKSWPMGWVLQSGDTIAGYLGNIPGVYEFRGRELLCGFGHSWVCDPKFRGHALFLLDRYLRQSGADLVMSNTVNSPSFHLHSQLGAVPVPIGRWDMTAVWITRYPQFLAHQLSRKRIPAARVLAYPAAASLAARDLGARVLLSARRKQGAGVTRAAGFDQRFDRFWSELRVRYSHKLLAVRDSSTLNWHFHYALRDGRVLIFTLTKGSDLVAYAIFVLPKRTPNDPILRLNLADFQSLDGHQGSYYALLDAALRQARRSGIHLVCTRGFSASGIDTSSLAPYHNALPNCTFIYKTRDPQLEKVLADPQAWSPSLYDADASL